MTLDQARPEVDQGIASVTAALKDPSQLAPFFRVPGLLRAEAVEDYVASLGIQMWSADFLADDWRNISPAKVYELAIKRIEARRKGILLLHDIHARTVQALPRILHELKARGYQIVQVVPASAGRPATPTEPQDWLVHRPSDNGPVARWPDIPTFDLAGATTHTSATAADFKLLSSGPTTTPQVARETAWPLVASSTFRETASALPVPAAHLFEIPDPMPTVVAKHVAVATQSWRRGIKATPARRAARLASLKKPAAAELSR
jgi:hypothetical protein